MAERRSLHSVVQALAALGSTQAIADELARRGIKGRQQRTYSCPIAMYLKRELNDESACMGFYCAFTHDERMDVPEIITRFVEEFDNNAYPNLIKVTHA